MKITINIKTSNAAFEEDIHEETGRIITAVAIGIDNGRSEGRCIDSNGNIVGDWSIKYAKGELI